MNRRVATNNPASSLHPRRHRMITRPQTSTTRPGDCACSHPEQKIPARCCFSAFSNFRSQLMRIFQPLTAHVCPCMARCELCSELRWDAVFSPNLTSPVLPAQTLALNTTADRSGCARLRAERFGHAELCRIRRNINSQLASLVPVNYFCYSRCVPPSLEH